MLLKQNTERHSVLISNHMYSIHKVYHINDNSYYYADITIKIFNVCKSPD